LISGTVIHLMRMMFSSPSCIFSLLYHVAFHDALAISAPYLRKPIGVAFLSGSSNASSLKSDAEKNIDTITQTFVKGASDSVVSVAKSLADSPRELHPFIFFHLRKSGGSTIREQLVKAAHKQRVRAYVACENDVPCMTYEPPPSHAGMDSWAIYGGHFDYPSMLRSLYVSEIGSARLNTPKVPFDCFVMVRETKSRVRSCWNYRQVEEADYFNRGKALDDMSVAEVGSQLSNAMSRYGEGCNNEALRVFSSSGRSEEVINALTPESLVAPALLTETLEHMQQCVVGVLERCDDTMEAVRGLLPWFSSYNCSELSRVGKIRPAKEHVKDDVGKEIARQNALDESVYKVANALLDAQLSYLGKRSKAKGSIKADDEEDRGILFFQSSAPCIRAVVAVTVCVVSLVYDLSA